MEKPLIGAEYSYCYNKNTVHVTQCVHAVRLSFLLAEPRSIITHRAGYIAPGHMVEPVRLLADIPPRDLGSSLGDELM